MVITKTMVKELCESARIEFPEEEYDNFVKDLQEMVNSFEILDEIENVNTIPLSGNKLNAETDLREDTPKQGLTLDAVIKNAPECCGGAIVVPNMVDSEEM